MRIIQTTKIVKDGELIVKVPAELSNAEVDIAYVPSTVEGNQEKLTLINTGLIPSEDIEIYLSAKYGDADCLVSGNRELIRAIADFKCLTPENFVNQYLKELI